MGDKIATLWGTKTTFRMVVVIRADERMASELCPAAGAPGRVFGRLGGLWFYNIVLYFLEVEACNISGMSCISV